MDAEALVRPVVEQAGFEFVELATAREHGRTVLRVMVDRPGGVDLDALSQLSATVSRHLDQRGLRGRSVRARGFVARHRTAAEAP